jgi:hypothetical protein
VVETVAALLPHDPGMPALQQRVPAVAPEPEVLLQLLLDEEPVGAPRKGGSVKTWSDYVAEAEQYKHYKQRCEQLEAELDRLRKDVAAILSPRSAHLSRDSIRTRLRAALAAGGDQR